MKPSRRVRGGPGSVVPAADVRSYYDHPVVKPPVWKPEVPWYFFTGGLAGASSTLAALAAASGNDSVARVATRAAAVGALASPVLLIADLGRPERALHMLRVAKITSPMSVGTWLLAAYAPAAVGAALLAHTSRLPTLRRTAVGIGALLGPAVGTYTAGLLTNTAIPVWAGARRTLPFVFAGGSVASAGATAVALLPPRDPGAALVRRVAVIGTALEAAAATAMERDLGSLGEPYREGAAGRYSRSARALSAVGVATLLTAGRRARVGAWAGAAMVLAGQVCERWAVFRAGSQSARRPADLIGAQRARVAT